MATVCSASTTIIVVKSEDLKFLVLRDNWLVTNKNVNLQLGNDSLVATKVMYYGAITNKKFQQLEWYSIFQSHCDQVNSILDDHTDSARCSIN
jgi:hypothetical protein